MKLSIPLLVVLALTSTPLSHSATQPKPSSAQAAASIEAQARRTLGVGVRALAFLFEAKPGTLILKDSLIADGSWAQLQALTKSGYVRIKELRSPDGVFLQVELTEKGKAVVAAFRQP